MTGFCSAVIGGNNNQPVLIGIRASCFNCFENFIAPFIRFFTGFNIVRILIAKARVVAGMILYVQR